MPDFFSETILEIFIEPIFKYIISPLFKVTGVALRWLVNGGQKRFTDLLEKPNNSLYGCLIWITLIIAIMLYFIFKK